MRPALACVLFALAGCGEKGPALVPAAGRATVDGQPLVGGSLTFHPESGTQAQGDKPSAQLQADGSFTMQTYPFGAGVVAGAYRVTLSRELAGRLKKPDLADPEKTKLRIDVPPGGVRDHVFDIK